MTKATKVHFHEIGRWDTNATKCNMPGKKTTDYGKVTCGNCRRILGLPPYKAPLPEKYRKRKSMPPKPSGKALDSLLRRAFQGTEGELAVALVEAEKALAESLKCKDPAEIIAELSGALRRLCDLLGSTSSN